MSLSIQTNENKTIKKLIDPKIQKKWKYVPNIITSFRIILAFLVVILLLVNLYVAIPGNFPGYAYFFSVKNNQNIFINQMYIGITHFRMWAGILFIVAAFSDFLDGYIARKYQVVSAFGKIFDPIADKLLVNGVLVCLAVDQTTFVYLVVLNIFRDIFVDGLRMYASAHKQIIPANWLGKIKTVILFASIISLLFCYDPLHTSNIRITYTYGINASLYLATLISLISGIIYFSLYYKQYLKRKKNQEDEKTTKY
ncbi:CDP-diacylglycerol--glycerol-3-phosphate 3-phosphatidyltransferase [Ureaplasma diversum]|uniref:CDP-diacylglycerol--glycerol-3-phosphate 3-phosphatidyltransferase n=1 Tax=Ureaplasma diversum NCTC 246 TaxID=1188241 RepID=A0A084F057_9BACT|nr:CDP-diacylglycerol--glycerol-3-phosphate 3-phosphatidyltransferase [Ureaplasma diversum]KEZ23599.1 CDP diacylglycerol-glycerol-3-phosphate3-phosphatidyltransferase [Ureaplasma diversum NCTC 246]